jgi:hypothetical protein
VKKILDIFQFTLDLPGPLALIACVLFVLLCWQALKLACTGFYLFGWCIDALKRVLISLSVKNVALCGLFALPIFLLRAQVSDLAQWVEQRYVDPAYMVADTSPHITAIFEMEIDRRLDKYESEVVKTRTRQLAARIGSTPLSIYMVALSECGLDPFRIRDDGTAASWIQFTTIGLHGLGVSLAEVKNMCYRRDIVGIMDLTDRYILRAAGTTPLPRPCDAYTAVFAPAYIGKPDDFVLYSGWDNPAYYLNAPALDGFYIADGLILQSRRMFDGKITIQDLYLSLEAKKARLIAAHGRRYKN